ncbi:DUF4115 domain-containing protein [bacterium]|nr:DUF4115 domain-containing protein [bacterium]
MNNEAIRNFGGEKYPEVGTTEVRRKIGEELRSARKFLDLSIEDVSTLIKVNVLYLENIENGKWGFLPPTYVKAFIQAIAKCLQLQSRDFDKRLDEMFDKVITGATFAKTGHIEDETEVFKPGQLFAWAEKHRAIIFYSLIGVVFIVLIGLWLTNPNRSPDRIAQNLLAEKEKPVSQPVIETKTDTVSADIKIEDKVKLTPAPVDNTYPFVIFATDTCYVKVAQDDSIIYERTLWPRNRITRKLDGTVKVTLGNPSGVRLIVNNDSLPTFPPGRRVRVIRVNKDGIVS